MSVIKFNNYQEIVDMRNDYEMIIMNHVDMIYLVTPKWLKHISFANSIAASFIALNGDFIENSNSLICGKMKIYSSHSMLKGYIATTIEDYRNLLENKCFI